MERERLVHNQRPRLAVGSGELRGEPVELLGLARKTSVHHKRVETEKAPTCSLEPPAVFAENVNESLPVRFRDRLRRGRTDRGRIVADVMIAGQITAGDRKAGVQLSGEFEIAAAGRAVPADNAAGEQE